MPAIPTALNPTSLASPELQRVGADRFGEITVGLQRVSVDGAVGPAGVEDLGEGAVEGCGGGDESISEVLRRVDDAVEHHRPQGVGVPLGVAEPDEGAVGEADVGDRVAAERLPDRFEVRHGSVGADVGEERTRSPVDAGFDVGGE